MEIQDTMEPVIRDGIKFLESLTRHYGQEEGMRIWDGIGEVVGADVKGQIFFAMLTGETSNRVGFLQGVAAHGYAVSCIKAIRGSTGMGLKEAKDAWDHAATKRNYVECHDGDAARALTIALRGFGCIV
jgi:ribosomal protein L7/L12